MPDIVIIHFFLTFCLAPYVFAVLMPTWRWLLVLTVIGGGWLAKVWIDDWIVTSDPHYREGISIGRGITTIITICFMSGVAIRALTLFMQSREVRFRYRLMTSIAGLPIVVAMIFLADALSSHPL